MIWGRHLAGLAAVAARAEGMSPSVQAAARAVADAVLSRRRVLVFGNGGSATQAQHLAAELVVRYRDERRALPGIALTADTAILTACANDYDFGAVFSRQIEALGAEGDVAFGLSTSGKSPNVLRALETARGMGMKTILLTGERGRAEASRWDVGVVVPSDETAHVQEVHLAVIHTICRAVEEALGSDRSGAATSGPSAGGSPARNR